MHALSPEQSVISASLSNEIGSDDNFVSETIDSCRLITTKQLAAILAVKPQTIEKWRHEDALDLPPVVKIGRLVRYRLADVEEFLNGIA